MGVIKQAIRSAGTEMDFLTEAARVIQSLSDKIVLTDSSIPEVYADNNDGYSGKPFLEFTVGGVYKLTLSRTQTLTRSSSPIGTGGHAGKYGLSGTAVGHYAIEIIHIPTGTTLTNVGSNYGLKFCVGVEYAHVEKVREWRVGMVKNAKALVVQLSPYNRSLIDADVMADIMLITDNGTHVFRGRLSTTSGYTYYADTGYLLDDQSTVTAVNRLPYYRDQTDESKIGMIGSKVFTDVTSSCVLTTDALIDVSTLSVLNRRITINGQTHYVLNANTIMPIS